VKLEVESVSKDFAGVHALSDVSLQLDEGDILAVIGPNGSGKTTLINVISGVIRPSSGRIVVEGKVLSSLPSYRVARAGLARTFQNIRLFKDMTVLENVETAAARSVRSRGFSRPRRVSRAALALLGLDPVAHTIVSTLPYGAQRRVEIARAIATQPRFLFLDEPAAGLNEAESDELLGLIGTLRGQLGCGVLVVDHDMRLIMRVSKRIHVLNEGKTLVEGAPEQVRHNEAVIQAYLGADYKTDSAAAEGSARQV
jgi:ABC-type branched-subunit amino acid transport system ATPase component